MKEIGGYFGIENSTGNGEFYPGLIALNSARNAFLYIVKAKKIKKVYIPYFLCDTVYEICKREKIDFEFYNVSESFVPIFEKKLKDNECLYIVNYYGLIEEKTVKSYKEKYKNIILDNVQAFFDKPVKDIDTIYSCRKFFGVPDGAYLSSDVRLQGLIRDNSEKRLSHIYGREKDGATAHYSEFKENEEKFYTLPLMTMSDITHELLSDIDYESVKLKREQNFMFLDNRLRRFNKLNLKCPNGPYAYPLYVEKSGNIRKILAEKKIYIAKLWPNVTDGLEAEMADNILPIPCDQRYSMIDMQVVVDSLLKAIKTDN